MSSPATTDSMPPLSGVPKKHTADLQEVQETVSRLASHKSVVAVLILNKSGDIVTQSGGGDGAVGNPKLLAKVLQAADLYVASMPTNEDEISPADPEGVDQAEGVESMLESMKTSKEESISFVRIRTPKHEILVAPKFGFTLVVFQDPSMASL
ncbi:hypothetical protein IV203_008199 [Nitzschia inconspicua]|uniref:Roadblock/LAMTOR2 domain-containing protein n=1 Tax=Nitzschia inconspicua TaxID=303405 RepID=A0A9K3K510_9STRA|nr:hypothetical protein IV203_011076 [Nitzschia inconspicua]KAG7352151.1 hypothetical protein IV203_008199 [Nitzschia inconspicua]